MSDALNTSTLPSFQIYQQQFTAYLRNPIANKPPRGVALNRMRVYAEIVFNNLFSSVSGCYPVCQKVLGPRAWKSLVRRFFNEYQSDTPIFREIPEQFLHYLNKRDDLPVFLPQLAHYEWMELAVSMMSGTLSAPVGDCSDLLVGKPVLNPALACVSYDYPVHLISPRLKPETTLSEPVHLLVYRNTEFVVEFIELNHLSARLISLLQEKLYTGQQALELIASELGHSNPQVIVEFGAVILYDLKSQGVILGVAVE